MLTEDGHNLTNCRACDGYGATLEYTECTVIPIYDGRRYTLRDEYHRTCWRCLGERFIHTQDNCEHPDCVAAVLAQTEGSV